MDDGDRKLNQLLADLYMKEQLIRVRGAATNVASFRASDMQDIDQRIDVLLARFQSN